MNYLVIFAGGIGSRMGASVPKQFLTIKNETILSLTIQKFHSSPVIDKIVVVTLNDYIDQVQSIIKNNGYNKVIEIIGGGRTAFESQCIGISFLVSKFGIDDNDIVLIHDGVRPFVDEKTIEESIETTKENGNCIVVSQASETIAIIEKDGKISKTIPRQSCLIARAPQTFYLRDLYNAHLRAKQENKEYIDSASMFLDQRVKLNPMVGPVENIKITTQYDYLLAQLLVEKNEKN